MMEQFALSAALAAALETKLLHALIETPRTPDDHARALGLDPRATGRVLDVLVAYGLAARDGELVRAADELSGFVRSMPGGPEMLSMWAYTPEFLRTGKPFWRMDGADKQRYAGVVGALGRMVETIATELAKRVTLEPAPARILDIGCGSGVWSLELAKRYPGARVTGLDQAEVLETFRARAAEHGLADRIDAMPGDVHELAIPREFDVAIVANVLRLDEPDRARHIVERAASALRTGGTMIIVDALGGGTPELERARTSYAIHLAMRTERGRVYAPTTVIEWMNGVGVTGCTQHSFGGPAAVGAIVGRISP